MSQFIDRVHQIAKEIDLINIANGMLGLLLDTYKAQFGSIYIIDQYYNLSPAACVPSSTDSDERQSIEINFSNNAVKIANPIIIKAAEISNSKYQILLTISNDVIRNVIFYPLLLGKKPLGCIFIYNSKIENCSLEKLDLIKQRLSSEIEKAILLRNTQSIVERQKSLTSIISKIVTTLDREQLLRIIIDNARQLLNVEATSLFMVDSKEGDILLRLASNIDQNVIEIIENVRVPYGKGVIGYVIESGETVLVKDTTSDKRHYSDIDHQSGFATHSILAVPLKARAVFLGSERGKIDERIIGGIEAINKINGQFTEEDAEMLRTLANQAATVLEIARLYSDTNELFMDVIGVLTAAIDAKDPYTEGHSQRVSHYSVEIAQELGLPDEMIQQIKIGGLLHDVGKIGIPDAILGKTGKLNEDEYKKMKDHPGIGAKIMKDVRMLNPILPALSAHHERINGSGYPDGLSGSEIPLISRIVTVADVFDAMTSNRPYRQALPAESAFEHLQKNAGDSFDDECVQALFRVYQKKNINQQIE